MTDYVLQAMKKTRECLLMAETHYGRPFLLSDVTFDLTGQAAGMLSVRERRTFTIRYNRALLEANPQHLITQTVPHEVAHLVAFQQFGFGIKPHGQEWKSVMKSVFHLQPDRLHTMDTSISTGASFVYKCNCPRELVFTKRMHSKIQKSAYRCEKCSFIIRFMEEREIETFKPEPASRLLVSSFGSPMSDAHFEKVKRILAGAEVGQAILHADASSRATSAKLAIKLALKSDQIQCYGSSSTIPDSLTHAIFFIDSPTDRQVGAIEKLRSRGTRVRLLKHPQKILSQTGN